MIYNVKPIYVCRIFILFLLGGCSPSSLGDFQHEGESRSRAIIDLLERVESYEQLIPLEPVLKKKFDALVELLIQAREFQENHPEESFSYLANPEPKISDQLQEVLKRVYAIEGGRELLERSQQEALVKLDAFERALLKKKGAYRH